MLQLTSVWVSPPSLVRQQQTKRWTHSPISLVWHFWDGLEQPRQALVVGGHVDGFPRHGGGVEPLTVHILLVQPGKSQVVAVTEVRENVFFQHCWQKRNPPPKTKPPISCLQPLYFAWTWPQPCTSCCCMLLLFFGGRDKKMQVAWLN